MTGSERPSPEPLLKKEASPAVLGGRDLEMLWSLPMPWIIAFGGSQPYSRGEFQETLWERFRGLSGILPEFLPESPSRTGGMAQPWSHKPALLNRRAGNCKVGGCMEAFANASPTPDQPSPTLWQPFLPTPLQTPLSQRRTNVQQLTCKMVWSFSFYYLLFSFLIFELKQQQNPLILRKSRGGKNAEKTLKKCENVWTSAKKCEKSAETILPFSCCPLVFLWLSVGPNQTRLEMRVNQERKNSININFLARISCGHSWPLTPECPGVKKFLPTTGGRRITHFWVRTSTIFGADVHDPKGGWKTLYKKSLRWFFGP